MVESDVGTMRLMGLGGTGGEDGTAGPGEGWVVDIGFAAKAAPGCDSVEPAGMGVGARDWGSGVSNVLDDVLAVR